jgi:gas vesicle protein
VKKLSFLMGVGVGFLLGSRSGRSTYEKVERKIREFLGQDQIQGTIDQVKDATDQLRDVAHDRVNDETDRMTQQVSDRLASR